MSKEDIKTNEKNISEYVLNRYSLLCNQINLFNEECGVKIFNKISLLDNNNNVNYLNIFEGLILKLKFPHDLKARWNQSISDSSKIVIKNILFFKSDNSFDMNTILETFKNITIFETNNHLQFDQSDIILKFISEYLLENQINLLIFIGCSLDSSIKEILDIHEIFYFEWFNWSNYQDLLNFIVKNEYTENDKLLFNNSLNVMMKSNSDSQLIMNLDLTIKNEKFLFFQIVDRIENEMNKNINFNVLINSRVEAYGKSLKYNFSVHFIRFLEIFNSNQNENSKSVRVFLFNSDFLSSLSENIKLDHKDLTFRLFINKIFKEAFIKILEQTNVCSFYYSAIKLTKLFQEFILNTKNLIYKYYY